MKSNFNKDTQIFSSLKVDVTFQDISKLLKTSKASHEIQKIARHTLKQMQGKWKPVALIKWLDFKLDSQEGFGQIFLNSNETILLDLGCSGAFLKSATHIMVCVHGIGEELDQESANASARGDFLEAYITDLIGLAALEKTSDIMKSIAEDQARKMGWGVGPFLSPGSVHGWDLEEQSKLCKLLPIDKINVALKKNSVLFPLKTIGALIGIGPDYETVKVGSSCDVCNSRNNCQMNRYK